VKEILDWATNARRFDIEGETAKKGGGGRTTCTELLGDDVNEVVDLVKAEDEVVVIGEVTVFLPVVAVTYDANR
jgi:hypothetical protein